MEQMVVVDNRRRNLRIALFVIILATLPFYCIGIFLWVRAPQQTPINRTSTQQSIVNQSATAAATRLPTQLATTPGSTRPTLTPFGTGNTFPTLINTPGQFNPPVVTRFLSPTAPVIIIPTTQPTVFFPSPTTAPTLTPVPSLTPIPPTLTPSTVPTVIPFPTDTPPVVQAPDSDGDGLPDNFDPCPFEPGTLNGCPEPTFTPSPTLLPF